MKSRKIKLEELKVKSFVVEQLENIKGGLQNGRTYLPALCPTEDGTICSGVLVCEKEEKEEKREQEKRKAF